MKASLLWTTAAQMLEPGFDPGQLLNLHQPSTAGLLMQPHLDTFCEKVEEEGGLQDRGQRAVGRSVRDSREKEKWSMLDHMFCEVRSIPFSR